MLIFFYPRKQIGNFEYDKYVKRAGTSPFNLYRGPNFFLIFGREK